MDDSIIQCKWEILRKHDYQIIEKDVSCLHREFRKTLDEFSNDRDKIIFVRNSREFLEDIPQKETGIFQKALPNDLLSDRAHFS